jgi:hypothetical protein
MTGWQCDKISAASERSLIGMQRVITPVKVEWLSNEACNTLYIQSVLQYSATTPNVRLEVTKQFHSPASQG